MLDPTTITVADLLDISALSALVLIVLFVGRYFIQRMEAFSKFQERQATESYAAILRITQDYADLQRKQTDAMHQLVDQIQNGQERRRREHEALETCVKSEHERTREQVRGLHGKLGRGAP